MSFLAAATTILSGVGAGLSAIGAIQQGKAQAAQANYEAQVARNNATIATQNAGYAAAAGEAKAYDTALAERQRAGAVTAGLAATGLDINTGSAEDVRRSEAELSQTNVERVRSNASLAAYGYRTQSTNFAAQSGLYGAEASSDLTGGYLKGLGSLLSAAPKLPFGSGSSDTSSSGIGNTAATGFGTGFVNGFDFSTA